MTSSNTAIVAQRRDSERFHLRSSLMVPRRLHSLHSSGFQRPLPVPSPIDVSMYRQWLEGDPSRSLFEKIHRTSVVPAPRAIRKSRQLANQNRVTPPGKICESPGELIFSGRDRTRVDIDNQL